MSWVRGLGFLGLGVRVFGFGVQGFGFDVSGFWCLGFRALCLGLGF